MRLSFLLPLLLLVGCASTQTPQRFNTGVALPRIAPFDASGKREDRHKGAFTASTSHSSGYDDAGKSQASNIVGFGGEFAPSAAFAFGLRPYGGDPMGSETGISWGAETWARWRPVATESFHFSIVPSYRYSRKRALEKFCTDTNGTFIPTSCVRHIDGYAEVGVSEPGLSVLFEFYLGQKNNSFALVPAVYYAKVHTENHLEGHAGDYELDAKLWNYSAMAYYLIRLGSRVKCMFQIGAGAAFTKEFNRGGTQKRDVEPLGDFGFTLGF